MTDKWFVRNASGSFGPINDRDLRTLLRQGSLSSDTLLRRDGQDSWLPMADVALALMPENVETPKASENSPSSPRAIAPGKSKNVSDLAAPSIDSKKKVDVGSIRPVVAPAGSKAGGRSRRLNATSKSLMIAAAVICVILGVAFLAMNSSPVNTGTAADFKGQLRHFEDLPPPVAAAIESGADVWEYEGDILYTPSDGPVAAHDVALRNATYIVITGPKEGYLVSKYEPNPAYMKRQLEKNRELHSSWARHDLSGSNPKSYFGDAKAPTPNSLRLNRYMFIGDGKDDTKPSFLCAVIRFSVDVEFQGSTSTWKFNKSGYQHYSDNKLPAQNTEQKHAAGQGRLVSASPPKFSNRLQINKPASWASVRPELKQAAVALGVEFPGSAAVPKTAGHRVIAESLIALKQLGWYRNGSETQPAREVDGTLDKQLGKSVVEHLTGIRPREVDGTLDKQLGGSRNGPEAPIFETTLQQVESVLGTRLKTTQYGDEGDIRSIQLGLEEGGLSELWQSKFEYHTWLRQDGGVVLVTAARQTPFQVFAVLTWQGKAMKYAAVPDDDKPTIAANSTPPKITQPASAPSQTGNPTVIPVATPTASALVDIGGKQPIPKISEPMTLPTPPPTATTTPLPAPPAPKSDEELRAYAAKQLEPWIPKINGILLSGLLRRAGTTLEVRGPDYKKVAELYGKRDWRALIEHFNGTTYPAFPDESAIDFAVQNCRGKSFVLYLKVTDLALVRQGANTTWEFSMFFITNSEAGIEVETEAGGWTAHPDKLGYTYEWNPKAAISVVAFGPEDLADNTARSLSSAKSQGFAYIDKKVELGELTADQAKIEREKVTQKLRDGLAKWLGIDAKLLPGTAVPTTGTIPPASPKPTSPP